MTDLTDHGQPEPDAISGDQPLSEVAVRDATAAVVRRPRWERRVMALRDRLPDLVRDPVVVATATVGAGVAARVVREVLRAARATNRADTGPNSVTGYFVHRIDVVHHVVHYVVDPARAVERRGRSWR